MVYDFLYEATNLINRANLLLEAAEEDAANELEDIENLEEIKEKLEDVMEKIDDVIEDEKEEAEEAEEEAEAEAEEESDVEPQTESVIWALDFASNALFEAASLCENAESAAVCIDNAEEMQHAIEDIAEETPQEDDDYNPDVNGGYENEDEYSDDDAVMDLIDDDEEVYDNILTDDEGSETVDL